MLPARLLLPLLLASAPVAVHAQTAEGLVRGQVVDPAGRPVAGAAAEAWRGGQRVAAGRTDADGRFALAVPAGAAVEVRVGAPGFGPVVQRAQAGEAPLVVALAEAVAEELTVEGEAAPVAAQVPVGVTRLPVALYEQPQTMAVVPERLLAQQEATTLFDVVRNVPGAYAWATFGGTNTTLGGRGYRGLAYVKNGVFVGTSLPAVEGFERVEVVKGAASVLAGVVSPGGLVHVQTKTPRFSPGGRVAVQAGSFGLVRPTLDVWGPLGAAGGPEVAYRLNGVYASGGVERAGVEAARAYVNPSVAVRLGGAMLTLEADALADDRTPDNGTIFVGETPFALPADRFTGFASDRLTTRATSASATLVVPLREALSLRVAAVRADERQDAQRLGPMSNALPGTTRLVRFVQRAETRQAGTTLQADLVGVARRTGPLRHDVRVGVDARATDRTALAFGSVRVDTVDVAAGPIPNALAPVAFAREAETATRSLALGATVQDVVTLAPGVKALLGLRYTTQAGETERLAFATAKTTVTAAPRVAGWTPSAGALVALGRGLAAFATYTNTFEPTTAVDARGEALGAQTTNQVETGLRAIAFGGRLAASATLYRIFADGLVVPVVAQDAAGAWREMPYSEKAGALRNQGVELEMNARPWPGVEATAGYSFVHARHLKSDKYADGAVPFNTPAHTANLWLHAAPAHGPLRGLSASLGVFATGERLANDRVKRPWHGIDPAAPVPVLPAYTTVTVALGYRVGPASLRAALDNAFDQRSYLAYRTQYVNPTAPRQASLSLAYAF